MQLGLYEFITGGLQDVTDILHTCIEIVRVPLSVYVIHYLNISKSSFEDKNGLSIIYYEYPDILYCTYTFLKYNDS